MKNKEIAIEKFREGYNCAQAVLFSLSKYTEMNPGDAIKIATGFGAGMGRTQHVCGAVSGGILVINLLFGREEGDDKEQQDITYAKVRKLIKEFEKRHNGLTCLDLLDGVDLLSDEGRNRFVSEKMRSRLCEKYIATVVEITEEIIVAG